jgi:hypothetical protein
MCHHWWRQLLLEKLAYPGGGKIETTNNTDLSYAVGFCCYIIINYFDDWSSTFAFRFTCMRAHAQVFQAKIDITMATQPCDLDANRLYYGVPSIFDEIVLFFQHPDLLLLLCCIWSSTHDRDPEEWASYGKRMSFYFTKKRVKVTLSPIIRVVAWWLLNQSNALVLCMYFFAKTSCFILWDNLMYLIRFYLIHVVKSGCSLWVTNGKLFNTLTKGKLFNTLVVLLPGFGRDIEGC